MADSGSCSHHNTSITLSPESPSIQVGRIPLIPLLLLTLPPSTYTSQPFMTTQWHVATFCSPQPPLFLILSPHPFPSLSPTLSFPYFPLSLVSLSPSLSLSYSLTSPTLSYFPLSLVSLFFSSSPLTHHSLRPPPSLPLPSPLPFLHQPIRLPLRRKASRHGARASLGTGAGGLSKSSPAPQRGTFHLSQNRRSSNKHFYFAVIPALSLPPSYSR